MPDKFIEGWFVDGAPTRRKQQAPSPLTDAARELLQENALPRELARFAALRPPAGVDVVEPPGEA